MTGMTGMTGWHLHPTAATTICRDGETMGVIMDRRVAVRIVELLNGDGGSRAEHFKATRNLYTNDVTCACGAQWNTVANCCTQSPG